MTGFAGASDSWVLPRSTWLSSCSKRSALSLAARTDQTHAATEPIPKLCFYLLVDSQFCKKRQKWPFSRSLTQNKPCLKLIHDLTLFHGARPYGAVVVLHGAVPHGAVVFSNVAAWARNLYV
jgi:hypothetical protein